MEKLLTIGGKRVIINTQYSKIGYGYPRLFIEVSEEKYINFDITMGAAFNMKKEDFKNWLIDAEVIPEDTYRQTLTEIGIDYEKFVEGIKELN